MTRGMTLACLVCCALGASAAPALADRIDGDWCNGSGSRITIDGPRIVTPSGRPVTGEYDRHAFRYVGPPGDAEYGVEILMVQRSEESMILYRGRGAWPDKGEPWTRCNVTS